MSKRSRSVLIIDDSQEDREFFKRFFSLDEDFSYTIFEAELGRQGLDFWQKHQPDVVLLDYRLPDMDGLEILRELSEVTEKSGLPVIIVSGKGNESLVVKAIKGGAQDYLVKGQITLEGLQVAVNATILAAQMRTELNQRVEKEQLVLQITQKIFQARNLDEIMQTVVVGVLEFLKIDYAAIFHLQPDGLSTIRAEAMAESLPSRLCDSYCDAYLKKDYFESMLQEHIAINLEEPKCVEQLSNTQAQAKLIVPIVQSEKLWGILVVVHCSTSRHWQSLEIGLIKELSAQLGIALQQADLSQKIQDELLERRRTEMELRESEEFKKRMVESSPDCIKVLDLKGRLIYMNSGGICLLEIEDFDSYLRSPWCRLWEGEYLEQAKQALAEALSGLIYNFQGYCPTVKGTPKWWDVSLSPMFNALGNVESVLVVSRDISDRKHAEVERERLLTEEQKAREEAERANQAKDDFLAIVSHELRAPLNPILGWAQLLQIRTFDKVKTAEALSTIERSAKSQAKLIDDLLDVAKILRGKLDLEAVPTNLALVIASALHDVKLAAEAKSILIHSFLSDAIFVSGDQTRLQQIIGNLLSNAVKFTPNHGRVHIQLQQVSNQAQITVSDTGKGIEPSFLPHIFESFRQEDSTTTRKYGGLGLGLAIVRTLVEAHGGTISAESKGAAKGATFTVCLPLIETNREVKPPIIVEKQEPQLAGIRVLIVDDDLDNRELLTVVLNQYGVEVLCVASAADALDCLDSFTPDILVSDIGMPDMDGYIFLQTLRSLPPEKGGQIPAIALTSYVRQQDIQRAFESGFHRHINKPINLDQFVQAVESLVLADTPPP